jgi:hypothetical protein
MQIEATSSAEHTSSNVLHLKESSTSLLGFCPRSVREICTVHRQNFGVGGLEASSGSDATIDQRSFVSA